MFLLGRRRILLPAIVRHYPKLIFPTFRRWGARDPPSSSFAGPPRSIINNITNKNALTPDANYAAPVATNSQITRKFSSGMKSSRQRSNICSQAEKSETFRFTFTTPKHQTPSMSTANSTPSASAESSTKKLMTRNPNGVYRWEGAGSAKRSRPRVTDMRPRHSAHRPQNLSAWS